jgi:hypothetical protein
LSRLFRNHQQVHHFLHVDFICIIESKHSKFMPAFASRYLLLNFSYLHNRLPDPSIPGTRPMRHNDAPVLRMHQAGAALPLAGAVTRHGHRSGEKRYAKVQITLFLRHYGAAIMPADSTALPGCTNSDLLNQLLI